LNAASPEAFPTVFIVDDDPGVLRALARLVGAEGHATATFPSAEAFLLAHDPATPGCLVLDLMMPELGGLEVQRRLLAAGSLRPIVFLTGRGDIPTTVRALRAGAIDFLTKPVVEHDLLDAIGRALRADAARRAVDDRERAEARRFAVLTPREHEVLVQVIAGRLNKQIAADLGTAEKTVKVHRGRLMAKLGLRSVTDLVRAAERAGIVAKDRA